MSADQGGTVSLGAAQIDIPAGALAGNATVTIRQRAAPAAVIATGGPSAVYQFETGGVALAGKVRLFLPSAEPAGSGELPALAFLNGDDQWQMVAATRTGNRLTTEVDHLSVWAAFDVVNWLLDHTGIANHLNRLFDLRATPPSCAAGRQGGTTLDYPSGSLPQPPLLTCVESDSDGNTTLKIGNNRSYAIHLTSSGLTVQPVDPLDARIVDHAIAEVASIGGQIVIPPGAHLSFLLGNQTGSGRLSFRPEPFTTLAVVIADIVAELVDPRFAIAKSIEIMDCVREIGGADDLAEIRDAVNRCAYQVIWGDSQDHLLAGLIRLPAKVAIKALATILFSVKVAVPVLDAWADVVLFHDVAGQLVLSHSLPKTPTTTPTPQPKPQPTAPTQQPPPQTPVVHYDCPNDNSNIGKYVPANHYWQNPFTAQGSVITGGLVNIGANTDGLNHQARVGIYGNAGLGSPLATVTLPVIGYDGETFTLLTPLHVTPGQTLYLTVVGIGDFTAYDNVSGCFIGRVIGYAQQ